MGAFFDQELLDRISNGQNRFHKTFRNAVKSHVACVDELPQTQSYYAERRSASLQKSKK